MECGDGLRISRSMANAPKINSGLPISSHLASGSSQANRAMSANQTPNPERESLSVVFLEHVNWHGDIQPQSPDGANATEMTSRFMVSEWDRARDFGAKLADRIFAALGHSIP